jgi:Flp pilus assembly protein TadB
MTVVRDRFQWGSYGVVVGLLLGLILGWLFHGVVGTIVRFGFVALVLIPFIVAFVVWRRLKDRGRDLKENVEARTASLRDGRDEVVETDSFVIETRADPRTEPRAERRER